MTHPVAFSPPVVFEILPSRRQRAMMGNLCLGEIRPNVGGRQVAAYYKLALKPGGEEQDQRPVTSVITARRNLLFRAAECFDSSPYGVAIAEALRAQAEREGR